MGAVALEGERGRGAFVIGPSFPPRGDTFVSATGEADDAGAGFTCVCIFVNQSREQDKERIIQFLGKE